VPVADLEALVKAIQAVFHNEKLRNDLSEKGYLRSLEFSVDRMVKAYEGFFLQVHVAGEGRGGR
jgi:glycosyltransferase involved in cell wall biosynthesis